MSKLLESKQSLTLIASSVLIHRLYYVIFYILKTRLSDMYLALLGRKKERAKIIGTGKVAEKSRKCNKPVRFNCTFSCTFCAYSCIHIRILRKSG